MTVHFEGTTGAETAHKPSYSRDNVLFGFGLVLYLFTRLWRIEDFPIFFFCDEAYHQNQIWEILGRGMRGVDGTFLPLFVEKAADRWVPQITLYLYLLPTILFGKSVLITRGLLAIVTVFAPIGCAITTRALGFRRWWLAPFVLSAIPTWLLHSRTAFETTLVPSFFACFLGWYVLYLQGRPKALALAALFGALAMYSHFSGTIVIFSAVALFALVHVGYHIRHIREVLIALLLGVVFLLPLIRFQLNLPAAAEKQLSVIDSDWMKPNLSLSQKIAGALSRYTQSLNPRYWFSAQAASQELERHRWGKEAHILPWTAPLFLLGALVMLVRVRRREVSTVVIALLVSVAPSLVVHAGIMRVFSYIIPVTIFITAAIDFLLSLMERLRPASTPVFAGILALVFSCQSLILTRDGLAHGPTWFDDYGLYGTQFGARQLFTKIGEVLRRDPQVRVHYSYDWANNPFEFPAFFLPPSDLNRLSFTSSDEITGSKKDVEQTRDLFALSAQDYLRVVKSGLFSNISIHEVIPFPDGNPGFIFVELTYLPDADRIIERRDQERRRPIVSNVYSHGQQLSIVHSKLDMGSIENVFDNNDETLIRGVVNPFFSRYLI